MYGRRYRVNITLGCLSIFISSGDNCQLASISSHYEFPRVILLAACHPHLQSLPPQFSAVLIEFLRQYLPDVWPSPYLRRSSVAYRLSPRALVRGVLRGRDSTSCSVCPRTETFSMLVYRQDGRYVLARYQGVPREDLRFSMHPKR